MSRSTEFKAGIAVAGVTDFRFYDTKWAEQYMKTEEVNKEGFEQNSLLRYAKDLHGKLLLVHGTYDDNVHIQNAWALANELIKANKRFEMMIYPMRMHGIADTPARIHLYSTMLDFWERNL
jgi:dipeptidyl-peptidase-4